MISYNEAAGRFEFQIVSDYRPGGKPKIRYARRALCMSCHQNGGPIFSRGVWSETNANPAIASVLRKVADRFEGVDVERGVDIPDAIDAAARRANRLAAYQWLWREGCEAIGRDAPAVRCRESAMIAALQYRLSGHQVYDASSRDFRDAVGGAMAGLATVQRGSGLEIPDPGLPNRNPLRAHEGNARSAAAPDPGVTAPFDPLTLRPPLETWSWNEPELLSRRLVAGIAEFITDGDARRLDAHLFDGGLARGAPRREWSFDCEMRTRRQEGARSRVAFACAAPGTSPPAARLEGWLHVDGLRVDEGVIDRMSFGERGFEPETLRNVSITEGSIVATRAEIARDAARGARRHACASRRWACGGAHPARVESARRHRVRATGDARRWEAHRSPSSRTSPPS